MPNNNQIICYHTWFAGFYKNSLLARIANKKRGVQTQRIDNVITEAYQLRTLSRPTFSCQKQIEFRIDKVMRWCIKVPQRVMGWPRKWAKWYRRWEPKRQGAI